MAKFLALLSGFVQAVALDIDLVVNFLDSLVDDQQELQICILGSLGPVGDAVEARKDFKEALHDRNFTEFTQGMDALDSFFHDIVVAKQYCDPFGSDRKDAWKILSDLSSIKDLKQHVKENFEADKADNIMAGFEAAAQAAGAKDWPTFGTAMGSAIHRMIVAPYPDDPRLKVALHEKPDWLTIDFVVNFMDALTNDQSEVLSCIWGALQPTADFIQAVHDGKAAIHDKNFTEFLSTIKDLNDFFHHSSDALQTCSPAVSDAKESAAVLSQLHSVKDILTQVKKNFHDDDQDNIMRQLEDFFRAFATHDYGTAGTDLGAVLHRTIIAAKYPDEIQV